MSVSIFASAVRQKLWFSCLDSLKSTSVDYEVVFAGNAENWETGVLLNQPNFKYRKTENIKPSQCYEIARRYCTKETVVWFCDDAETPNDVLGKAYKYWKSKNNEKLILSIQTKESGYKNIKGSLFPMQIHRLIGGLNNTPLMAPLGMMSRKFLEELGGLDHRYVCGQYENDIVMRAYSQGATVEIFGDPDCYIDIDHLGKSLLIGECTNDDDFRQRPFATGYTHDRSILEKSWITSDGKISMVQLDKFEPYAKDISLTESESYKGKWE